jgi:hypothetical protein
VSFPLDELVEHAPADGRAVGDGEDAHAADSIPTPPDRRRRG